MRATATAAIRSSVAAYRIRAVGAASDKTLALTLVERTDADAVGATRDPLPPHTAKPVAWMARPGRGTALPGRATARNHVPQAVPPPVASPPPVAPTPADADGDGTLDAQDCAPRNARSGRVPPTSRTSASSTRTATGSTGRRRMRSSSRHSARTTIRARDRSRSGRSRQRFRRQRRRRSGNVAMSSRLKGPTVVSRSRAVSPSTGDTRRAAGHRGTRPGRR